MEQRLTASGVARLGAAATITMLGGTIMVNGQPVSAASFTVLNTDASGAGSLLEAIQSANGNAGADTITFYDGVTGVITLPYAANITDDLTLTGPGNGLLTIQSSGGGVLYFYGNSSAPAITGSVSGVTISGATTDGVRALNTLLTLDAVRLTGNERGLSVTNGGLTLTNSFVTGSPDGGVALFTTTAASLIEGTEITGNGSLYDSMRGGAGLYLSSIDAGVTIRDSTIADNVAYGEGGGIFIRDAAARIDIESTYITGNLAVRGAGIQISYTGGDAAKITISDSTISGNQTASIFSRYGRRTAVDVPPVGGDGGGIAIAGYVYDGLNSDPSIELDNVTISNNRAYSGGGIAIDGPTGGQITIVESTISGNEAVGAPGAYGAGRYATGGGIFMTGTYDTSMLILRTDVLDNRAAYGAGIDIRSTEYSEIAIAYSTISGNETIGAPEGYSDAVSNAPGPYESAYIGGAGGGLRVQEGVGGYLAISETTISNNEARHGGGIHLADLEDVPVTISDSILTGNIVDNSDGRGDAGYLPIFGYAAAGAAINARYLRYSSLSIEDSVIEGNTSDLGAITGLLAPEIRIANSSISDNVGTQFGGIFSMPSLPFGPGGDTASSGPGAIVASDDEARLSGPEGPYVPMLEITGSTISGNSLDDEDEFYGIVATGVAVYSGNFLMDGVTVSGNGSVGRPNSVTVLVGGGVSAFVNTTIAGNTTGDGSPVGAINAELAVRHSTISGNDVDGDSTAIEAAAAEVLIDHSIVAGNGASVFVTNDESPIVVTNSLLESSASIVLAGDGSNVFADDPELGPLADNGGPTETMLPLATSLAREGGDPSIVDPPTTDQRGDGFDRVIGVIDIGAVEQAAAEPGSVTLSPASVTVAEDDGSAVVTVTRSGTAEGAAAVNVATVAGSATAGTDFTAVSTVVTWADGETGPKTVTVPILTDTVDPEADETFTVVLDSPTRGLAVDVGTATITIQNVASVASPPVTTTPATTTTTTTTTTTVPNGTPTITQIADQVVTPGGSLTLPFTASDTENNSNLVISVQADSDLLTKLGIGLPGSAEQGYFEATVLNRTVEIQAGSGLGSTLVTLTVSDGEVSTTETFRVSIEAAVLPATGSNNSTGLLAALGGGFIALGGVIRRTSRRTR